MNKYLKTRNCVVCGAPATVWSGTVHAYRKMALGNTIPLRIFAGKCAKHKESQIIDDEFQEKYGIADTDLFGNRIEPETIFSK